MLSEQQRKRLRQIFIQVANGYALTKSSIPELQLWAEQSKGVRRLQNQWLTDSIAMPKETTDKAERLAKRKKLSQELRKDFEALLTP